MDWLRIILDGFAMATVFNVTAGIFWFVMPHPYAHILPKEIKEAAAPYTAKELRALALVIYPLFLGVIIWMILSAHSAGIQGFWKLFWTAYIEMLFVNFGDFFFLDCWLRAVAKDRGMIKGTEHCKAWECKEWMKQAVPEHFLVWPLVICTIAGFICAGIGSWIA